MQIALNSGQWEVDNGEWAVYSVQWTITVGSRQRTFKFGLAIFGSFASFYVASEKQLNSAARRSRQICEIVTLLDKSNISIYLNLTHS